MKIVKGLDIVLFYLLKIILGRIKYSKVLFALFYSWVKSSSDKSKKLQIK
jgi:hypothetical protein